MNRSEMGSFSRWLADQNLTGFVLGRMIAAKLANRDLPREVTLPPDVAKRITVGEIIDAIEGVEQGQDALHILTEEIERIHENFKMALKRMVSLTPPRS